MCPYRKYKILYIKQPTHRDVRPKIRRSVLRICSAGKSGLFIKEDLKDGDGVSAALFTSDLTFWVAMVTMQASITLATK